MLLSSICGNKLAVTKLAVTKLAVSKVAVSKLAVTKLARFIRQFLGINSNDYVTLDKGSSAFAFFVSKNG
jgi:hypothetical protein